MMVALPLLVVQPRRMQLKAGLCPLLQLQFMIETQIRTARPVPRGMPRRTPRPSLRPHSNYEPAPPSEPASVPPAPVPARAPAATSMQRAGSALRSAMARRRPGGTSQSDTRNLGV